MFCESRSETGTGSRGGINSMLQLMSSCRHINVEDQVRCQGSLGLLLEPFVCASMIWMHHSHLAVCFACMPSPTVSSQPWNVDRRVAKRSLIAWICYRIQTAERQGTQVRTHLYNASSSRSSLVSVTLETWVLGPRRGEECSEFSIRLVGI